MPLLATPLRNRFSHIGYILFCAETGDAAAVDPFDIDRTLAVAGDHGLTITAIVNTHEHWDHSGRNEKLRARTGARVHASRWAAGMIERIDVALAEGDVVKVGRSLELEVIETPGHTMTHICLLGADAGRPLLICGDTLFGAGVGNTLYGGHAPTLFGTIGKLRSRVPADAILYPGHDYLARNLGFALSVEPQNAAASGLLAAVGGDGAEVRFTTMDEEQGINPFMRLGSSGIRRTLGLDAESDETVFLRLRSLRDSW